MTKLELYEFLRGSELAVLATVSESGAPQAALVGFAVTPELEIVFDTVKTSRKYGNLRADPRCGLVVGWTGEITLQYEGLAEELAGDGAGASAYKDVYFQKWPDGRARESWPDIAYFVVRPTWIRYSDFGRKLAEIYEQRFG